MFNKYGYNAPANNGVMDPMDPSGFLASLGNYGSPVPANNGLYLAVDIPGMMAGTAPSMPTIPGIPSGPGGDGGGSGFWGSMIGTKDDPGWGGMALGTVNSLMNAYMGMKQYGLAKDTLNANKEQFSKNFEAQRKTTNSSLEDRQRARVASNPGAYESVSSYMQRNGV